MCGINGFNFVDVKLIKKMNDSLKHRGPDAQGSFFSKGVSLGHRRLSILDLSQSANQPMTYSYKKRKAIIVFNGEVYNFGEIKEQLEKKGYKFRTSGDTEVILASYLEYGFDCVKKFNGMWAFCIYDVNKKILFLSRDRLGKKPLHYYFDGSKFIFSSEIKGILNHDINKKINNEAVDLYFSLGFIPAPWTIYKNIKKLEARYNLIFDLDAKKIKKVSYYDFPEYNPIYDKKKLISQGKELLLDATKLRMISDVPLGAFLSGGLDSSSVVGEMTKLTNKENLNTFSIGFEGKYDETKYVHIIKNYFHTKHHHKYFKEKDFKEISNKFLDYFDEPFSDPSLFPTMFLSEFARNKLTVSLSGDGGDEIFGGYPRYKIGAQIQVLKKIPSIIRKMMILCLPSCRMKQGIQTSLLPLKEIYSSSKEDVYKPRLYQDYIKEKTQECINLSKGDIVETLILLDRYYLTLPDNYLTKVDISSMAYALEVRSPFLDYRFLDYSSKIPAKWKANCFKTKILMRQLIKELIPQDILNQKKKGFTPPIQDWILKKEYENQLKESLESLSEKSLISKEWKQFFYTRILNNKDLLSKNYRIRLLIFSRWYNSSVKQNQ